MQTKTLSTPLSSRIEQKLRASFPPSDQDNIRNILLEYGPASEHHEIDRVRYDVLHLAGGNLSKVRTLITSAKRNYRNVLSGEYRRVDGRSIPHDWAMVHTANA